MKRNGMWLWLLLAAVALIALPLGADGAQQRPHLEITTDGPAGADGARVPQVLQFLGGQGSAKRKEREGRNITLIGALQLDPFNLEVHGDVAGYKNLAFVGKWREACPGTGVDIIDISKPRRPVKIASTRDYPDTSMEDMQAIRIGRRDVLAIGLQDCGNDPTPGVGTVGLELYDITNPRNPQFLSLFNGEDFGMEAAHGHVHEFDLVKRRDGRVLAALASPDLEVITSDAEFRNGIGDLLIVDITDPANPTLVGEYGVLDDPQFGLDFYLGVRQGGDARTLLHSARFNADGTRLYLSYWDAGVLILDVSDPAHPVVIGRTEFAPGQEGNAHSVAETRRGRILIQADEDYTPFELVFTSSAFAGPRPAAEGAFTPPVVSLPGRAMAGQVVHVGRGCPRDPATGLSAPDPYLADPAGKIALIERGLCRFDNKIGRAQQAGAIGAIVYNNAAGGEGLVLMGGNSPVLLGSPDVIGTVITIAGVFVQRSTGLLLREGTSPVTARAEAVFNGWGFLRFFDISDLANPVPISTFATPNTNNVDVALQGPWRTVHNPEVVGNTLYASWYGDGVRVIDVSDPSAPMEVGFWTGAGAPAGAPPVNIWSVVPHRGLLLVSDRNFGLYILKADRDDDDEDDRGRRRGRGGDDDDDRRRSRGRGGDDDDDRGWGRGGGRGDRNGD